MMPRPASCVRAKPAASSASIRVVLPDPGPPVMTMRWSLCMAVDPLSWPRMMRARSRWRPDMPGPMLFEPIAIRDGTLKNRVVVAPMHQYSAVDGFATDWHLMNAGRYAAGGAGLVIMESTKVERRGCGTVGDLGLWDDAFIPGLKRCVDFIRLHNAVPGIQLGHSGRKARRFRACDRCVFFPPPQNAVPGIQLGHSGRRARRFRPWEGGGPLKPSPEIADWDAWELVSSSALNAPQSDPTPPALPAAENPQ